MMTKIKTFLKTNKDLIEAVAIFAACAGIGVGVGMLTYEGAKAGFYKAFETWTIQVTPVVKNEFTKVN